MTNASELRGALRLGVVCDPTRLATWQALCLEKLAASEGVATTLLTPPAGGPPHERGGWLWRWYSRCVARRRSRALAPAPLPAALAAAPVIGLDEALAHSGPPRWDAILTLYPNGADALRALAPRYGVWAFRYGLDGAWGRAVPALWAIIGGEQTIGASLQRLADGAGPARILRRGCARVVRNAYAASVDAALAMCAAWPAQACNDIRYGHADRWPEVKAPASMILKEAPSSFETLRLMAMLAVNTLRELAGRMMVPMWNVGVVEQPIARFLEPGYTPAVRWLPPLPGVFRADPFGLSHDGRTTILCEHLDYRRPVGELRALTLDSDGRILDERLILNSMEHCSYPYLLQYDGQIYCVPEILGANEIALYRAEAFPQAWVKAATLVARFKGGDATVFQHEGRWWLLANDSGQGMDHALYAWYADNLLGPWSPHLNNPIKNDVRSSRPAGAPFIHQGRLIRPAQDCALRYGHRVALNHVLRLTPDDFAEETLTTVGPLADSPYPYGMHTLSAAGEITLVDGLRYHFFAATPRLAWHGLRRLPYIVRGLWSQDDHAFSCH